MAETEIKKVISVDVGSASSSIKDYKNHIDELRGSLLQLDETSQEYEEISKEIAKEQDKLNRVMKVGKATADAADGSYNQMTQTMAKLKSQWRATADEAERAQLGGQILDINNKLKELDASTGNYQRNVGDYANAFEQAFGKCLDGITKIDGPLGKVGGTVKNMIPVIKSVNSTALTGLSGIKKAIASTGIGLLVVAVGELAAHWEDVKKIVQKMTGIQDAYTLAVESSTRQMKALKDEVAATSSEMEYQARIMKAMGASQLEILNTRLKGEVEMQNNLTAEALRLQGIYDTLSKGNSIERKRAEAMKEQLDSAWELVYAQEKTVDNTRKAIHIEEIVQEQMQKALETTKETTEENKNLNTVLKERAQIDLIPELEPKKAYEDVETYVKTIEEKLKELEARLSQEKFDIGLGAWDRESIDTLDMIWEKESQYYVDKLAMIDAEISAEEAGTDRYRELVQMRMDANQEYYNASNKWSEEHKKKNKKDAEEEARDRKIAWQSAASSISSILGSLSELMEDGSKEQKDLMIMETTINTLSGAIAAFQSMSGIPIVGPALGAAAAAAVTAAGIANIAKIKSTTKGSGSSGGSVSVGSLSTSPAAQAKPLLNESEDINRLVSLNENGDSTNTDSNLRVYVVDQDIRDANKRAEVVESNATF